MALAPECKYPACTSPFTPCVSGQGIFTILCFPLAMSMHPLQPGAMPYFEKSSLLKYRERLSPVLHPMGVSENSSPHSVSSYSSSIISSSGPPSIIQFLGEPLILLILSMWTSTPRTQSSDLSGTGAASALKRRA